MAKYTKPNYSKLSTTFSNFLLNCKLSKLTVKLGANVI